MAIPFRSISTYSLGGILNRSVQFLLLPVYTQFFSTNDYGQLELVYVILAVLNITNGLLIQNGYARLFFDRKNESERSSLYGGAISFILVVSMLVVFVGFMLEDQIASSFMDFENDNYILKLVLISGFFRSLSMVQYKDLIIRKKPKIFIIIHFFALLLTLLLTAFLVIALDYRIEGVLYAQIISGAAQCIVLFVFTSKKGMHRIYLNDILEMLGFSVFMILPAFSSLIINLLNRYFIAEYKSFDDVGLYSLGARIASVIPLLFTEPVKKAIGPHIYSLAQNTDECKAELRYFTKIFFGAIVLVAFGISLFSREIIMLIAKPEYLQSHTIVPFLSLSYILYGLAGIIVFAIHITKKTWVITLIFLLSSAASICLNILLIPRYGIWGAALSHNISILIIVSGYFLAIHYIYRIGFEYLRFFYLLLVAVVLYFTTILIDLPIILLLGYKLLLVFLFIFIVLKFYLKLASITNSWKLIIGKIFPG